MRRFAALVVAFVVSSAAQAGDPFDEYINPILGKVPEAKEAKQIKELTTDLITENDQVIPNTDCAMIVVQTNENRYAKLLVQMARRKISDDKTLPILLIDRFVTYRPGEDLAFYARGNNVNLFNGFRFSLDMGQVVPEELGGDLRFVAEGGKLQVETLGKAKMFLLTKPLPEAQPKKGGKLVIGPKFEAKYFAGKYKLYDDGKRSGVLTLTVDENDNVKGHLVSDTDGKKYELNGKVGKEKNFVEFTVTLPRTEQSFAGWMFTGDGKAITGSSKMLAAAGQQAREMGFYAVRIED
jgi:hypothetical protein